MKPAPMTDEQIAYAANICRWSKTYHADFANAITAARDKQWEQMLASQPQQWVEGKVYPIDNATPPEPETGFSLLGELM